MQRTIYKHNLPSDTNFEFPTNAEHSEFAGEQLIEPKVTDLGYYRWRSGKVISNDSLNFKVLQDPQEGLLFQNRFDRRIIIPRQDPGPNTVRKRVYSTQYHLVVLFDHVVRQRI